MAKTLREFLEERAERDFSYAERIFRNSIIGLGTDQRLKQAKKIADMWKFDTPQLSDHTYNIQKAGLYRISLMMLSVAGEAVKKLESQVPDIHDRYPGFPWDNFKRLRDLNVKYGEAIDSGEATDEITVKLNKEVDAINALGEFDSLDPKFSGLPYFRLICVCLNWGSAIDSFTESHNTDRITIRPTPALKELSSKIGMSQAGLPILFESQSSRDVMHAVFEQLKKPSIFFQKVHPKLYDTTHMKTLKDIRNKYAHFVDFFEAHAATTSENYFLDITTFNPEEFASLMNVYAHISKNLDRVRQAFYYGKNDEYALAMAKDYERAVLGTAYSDEAKKALMDEQVQWVTKNTVKSRNEDAFVVASGDLLQNFSVADARSVFTFIRTRKNELGKPSELIKGVEGQSYVVQAGVKRFAESIKRALGHQVRSEVAA